MEIKFTKKQYEDLIKLVYLGEWMINAYHTNDRVKNFEELEQYILSFYKDFGMEKYIVFDERLKRFFNTKAFEEETEVEQYIDEYNDNTFWDELLYRLANRDFVEQYGEKAIKKMTWEERIEKEQPFIEKYANEFERNGIKNLVIINF